MKRKVKKVYQWRHEWMSKDVDPNLAVKEITKAEDIYGKVTPGTVLNVAKEKDSPIHSLFQWDDSIAGEKYRLIQARKLINNLEIKIVRNNETVSIPTFEIVRRDESNQFKSIEVMTVDDVEFVKLSIIKEITRLTEKLSVYKKFNEVVGDLNKVKEKLEKL